MRNKELLLWQWKDCSRHPGTMHWCAVPLDYLISTLWYDEIAFTLLACRYWSLKPYLIADTFKDLIYVKHSSFFTQLGRERGKKTAINICLFETWCWPMARDLGLLFSHELEIPSGMPSPNITSTPNLRKVLSRCTSLVSQGWCLPQIIQWIVLKCAHLDEPWARPFLLAWKKGGKAMQAIVDVQRKLFTRSLHLPLCFFLHSIP